MADKKTSEDKKPAVDPALQARWEAFLAKAEEEARKNGTHHIFEAQKENGEFDTIPESFKIPSNIRSKV